MATRTNSRKLPAEVLTSDEVKALIGACSNRAPTGIRNRALIVLMWRCGLRIGEALDLEPRDVDLEAGTVRVRHGKGDRSRTVGIDPQAAAAVGRWLDRRKALGHNGHRKLICTLDGKPLRQDYVRHMLRRQAAKAGIERRVHPHGLRHTYAAGMVREGAQIHVLRNALGHSTVATTDRYLRDVAPGDVIDAMKAREW